MRADVGARHATVHSSRSCAVDGQRGWVGMIVLLLALVIVACLAKDALHEVRARAGRCDDEAATPAERARAPRRRHGASDPAARRRRRRPRIERGARRRRHALKQQSDEARRRLRARRVRGVMHNRSRVCRAADAACPTTTRIRSSPARAGRSSRSRSSPRWCSRWPDCGSSPSLAWLAGRCSSLQFFRDPPRDGAAASPKAVLSPADGKIVSVEKARDPYLDRDALKISVFMNVFNVHSNRSPVDGDGGRPRGTTPAASSTRRSTRRRSKTSATRCTCARRDGQRRDVRADRGPDRAPHPLLRRSRATRWRAASATASSASARASTSTSRPTREPRVAVGDTVARDRRRSSRSLAR